MRPVSLKGPGLFKGCKYQLVKCQIERPGMVTSRTEEMRATLEVKTDVIR